MLINAIFENDCAYINIDDLKTVENQDCISFRLSNDNSSIIAGDVVNRSKSITSENYYQLSYGIHLHKPGNISFIYLKQSAKSSNFFSGAFRFFLDQPVYRAANKTGILPVTSASGCCLSSSALSVSVGY